MDLLKFVDSKDIREHFRKINCQFSTVEAAFIVWQSGRVPLTEKIAAWREIIDTMPDCSLPLRRNNGFIKSFHAKLVDYIEQQEQRLDKFIRNERFSYYITSSFGTGGGCESDRYDSLEKMYGDIRDEIAFCRKNPENKSDKHKYPCIINIYGKNNIWARLNYNLEITFVEDDLDTLDEFKLSSLFKDMYFAFPVPFKRGDVLSLNYAPSHIGHPMIHIIANEIKNQNDTGLLKNGSVFNMVISEYSEVREPQKVWYLGLEKDSSFLNMDYADDIKRISNLLKSGTVGKTSACCFTGHREFLWGDNTEDERHKALIIELEKAVDTALSKGITHFICGNALGFDTWAAQTVLKKKFENPNIILEIAIPFEGHNEHERDCIEVQKAADIVHIVSSAKSHKDAYSERNRYMVLHSDMLIAALDESHRRSGTAKTVEFAAQRGLEIIWLKV